MGDAILWDDTIEEVFFHTVDFLDVCGKNGVVLNTPPKFGFEMKRVPFAGFEISPTSVCPCPKSIDAIQHFPTPHNITGIRSWFGRLVNQMSYAFAMAPRIAPSRWTEELQKALEQSKAIIISEIQNGVEIYDKNLPTCPITDWSWEGIGYWLLQKHCTCASNQPFCCKSGWKVTMIGSRFTLNAGSGYSPVEGETLQAIVDALDKAHHYVLGCPDLTIVTDHNPLVKLFGDRALTDIPNPRLLCLKERSLLYRFKIKHISRAHNRTADALSCHPVGDPSTDESPENKPCVHTAYLSAIHVLHPHADVGYISSLQDSDIFRISSLQGSSPVSYVAWRAATNNDDSMLQLRLLIEEGAPERRNDWPEDMRHFFRYRNDLSWFDDVILYRDRVVIPHSLRDRILQSLLSAHQGVSHMISRAESSFFWPGMTPAIADLRRRCNECNRMAPSQPQAPPIPTTLPVHPFQCIAADYFTFKGRNYVVAVDRYSNCRFGDWWSCWSHCLPSP